MARLTQFGAEADSQQLREVAGRVEAAAAGVKGLHPMLLSREGGTVSDHAGDLDALARRLRAIASYVDRYAAYPPDVREAIGQWTADTAEVIQGRQSPLRKPPVREGG